ncbi:MAG TPA: NAD-dependent epimerase/dehydratase family protein [Gaiellales bacterium]|nr:NAD-dependent epimerase/dehydratase family protein [Gaiellales bacterium]
MPIRALVTGGAGFIGSHVVDGLLERGDEVVVVDNLQSGRRERVPAGAALHQLDIRDTAALRGLVSDVLPHAIFHLAAQADVRMSVEDPGHDADCNVRGTAEVLEAARTVGARVVYSSTGGAIYGDVQQIPTPEGTACAPMAPYGVSKLCGEQYLELYNRLYGTRHVTLRYGNVYGPRQDLHGEAGVVAIFFGRLVAGETPLVFGDGLQTRDYVYVGDVVEANLAALEYQGARRVFNIGTGRETDVLSLLAACQTAAGTSLEAEHRPARLGELQRSCLEVSLAARDLGWEAATPLAAGLSATLESIRR